MTNQWNGWHFEASGIHSGWHDAYCCKAVPQSVISKCDFKIKHITSVILPSCTGLLNVCVIYSTKPCNKVCKYGNMSQKLKVWFLEEKKLNLSATKEAACLTFWSGKSFRKMIFATCVLLTNVWKNILFFEVCSRRLEVYMLLLYKHGICSLMDWDWIVFVYS